MITFWLSTGIHIDSKNTDLFSVNNSSNNSPALLNQNNRLGVTFSGNYMKQNKLGYAHGTVVNIYIVYEFKNRRINNPDFTVANDLFGAVEIIKDTDTSHYKYSGYGICFDAESDFSFGNIVNRKNVIFFGADMSFSSRSHERNRQNEIYVLGKDFIQGVTTVGPTALTGKTSKGTTIYAEDIYKHNFTEPDKKFVLSLYYNGDDCYLFANGNKELKSNSAINYKDRNLLCLGNISSDWSLTNSTKTGLYGNAYDLAVDYLPLSGVKTIYDIQRYLMKQHDIVQNV